MTNEILGCSIGSFPCKYLGLPLNIRKLAAPQFQYLSDQLANKLPTWRGTSLPKSGRLMLAQLVLCAIPIHALMALDLPPKTILALEKIGRGFLWCVKQEAHGGNCLVLGSRFAPHARLVDLAFPTYGG